MQRKWRINDGSNTRILFNRSFLGWLIGLPTCTTVRSIYARLHVICVDYFNLFVECLLNEFPVCQNDVCSKRKWPAKKESTLNVSQKRKRADTQSAWTSRSRGNRRFWSALSWRWFIISLGNITSVLLGGCAVYTWCNHWCKPLV